MDNGLMDQVDRANDLVLELSGLLSGPSSSTGNYTGASGSRAMFCHDYDDDDDDDDDYNDDEYNMRHKKRGLALIFNHENFDVPTLAPRTGTNVDCENLTKVLKNLDFDVNVFKDCSRNELKQQLVRASQKDHTDNDCILVAIMSHGGKGYLYAKDKTYKLEDILNYFTPKSCRTLFGKPKLFFIQACQGDLHDLGDTLNRRTEIDGATSMSCTIPTFADFLIAYSTIPGFVSWRNLTEGSWFIQALCNKLAKYGKRLDILTLLTRVNKEVANKESNKKKQMPHFDTFLTRTLCFGTTSKSRYNYH